MIQKLRLRKREGGFTLIELLIVVAIIGIIAALLIPNFLDALQKAKQKRTVADTRNIGTAYMSWVTDQVSAGAAGADVDTASYVETDDWTFLVSQYIQDLPDVDGWKNPYKYKRNTNVGRPQLGLIRSGGNDGDTDTTIASSYSVEAFDPTDYAQDIVWADGFFVRWPQKTT